MFKQMNKYEKSPVNAVAKESKDEIVCSRRERRIMVMGSPLCDFDGEVPVQSVSAMALGDSDQLQLAMYFMRGTSEDVKYLTDYFDAKYPEATAYYLRNTKHPRFYGHTKAWKFSDQYIVIGQHEPGYAPRDMSLQLLIGTVEGIGHAGTDLNSCK